MLQDLLDKWNKQKEMTVKTATFRNTTEANIFVATLKENFISMVKSRSGIIVTYYE